MNWTTRVNGSSPEAWPPWVARLGENCTILKSGLNATSGYNTEETSVAISEVCHVAGQSLFTKLWPVLAILSVVSIAGNLGVLQAVSCSKRFHKPENFMLANLCGNSLMMIMIRIAYAGLRKLPSTSYHWSVCLVTGFAMHVNMPVEAFTVMCMTKERMRSLSWPLRRESSKESIRRKILCIWALSILLTLPGGSMSSIRDGATEGFPKCSTGYGYFYGAGVYIGIQTVYFMSTLLLPLVAILTDCCRLAAKLKCPVRWQPTNELQSGFCQISSEHKLKLH